MDLEGLRLIRLLPEQELKPFDCSDNDLNDFFLMMQKIIKKIYLLLLI